MMFAKNLSIDQKIKGEIENRQVTKCYVAEVVGVFPE
jgi:23S rRNA-/tRNA-specific pseudouridylate synthase